MTPLLLIILQVEDAFKGFFKSYDMQGILDQGYIFLGDQQSLRQQIDVAIESYETAFKVGSYQNLIKLGE